MPYCLPSVCLCLSISLCLYLTARVLFVSWDIEWTLETLLITDPLNILCHHRAERIGLIKWITLLDIFFAQNCLAAWWEKKTCMTKGDQIPLSSSCSAGITVVESWMVAGYLRTAWTCKWSKQSSQLPQSLYFLVALTVWLIWEIEKRELLPIVDTREPL